MCGKGAVIARIELCLRVFDVEDLRCRAIEEITVVGNDEQRFRISAQVLLEPIERVGIEMVGRLVEDENIGLDEKQTNEREARSFAAAERIDGLVLLAFGEAEAGEHRTDAGFIFISADLTEFFGEPCEIRDHALVSLVVGRACVRFDLGL